VDTPGLDAYGYEKHETLTMKLFLPTVDVVVYLTDAKPSTDGVTANYLDCIGENRKPLVFVQNKIDSIEPKIGLGACVERSRQEVAQDHLDRLRRLLSEQYADCVRVAPILQVSAKLALDGKLDDSHILDLVSEVDRHLSAIEPQLSRGRHEQLLLHLQTIITREKNALSRPSVRRAAADDEQRILVEAGKTLNAGLTSLQRKLAALEMDANETAETFRNDASRLGARSIPRAKDLSSQCEAWLADLPEKFGSVLQGAQRQIEKAATSLNLNADDYLFEPPRAPSQRRIRVKAETREETDWVEQAGAWGSIKRFFGGGRGWGYETRTRTHNDLDAADFQRRVEDAVSAQLNWASDAGQRVTKTLQGRVAALRKEIERQQAAIKQQLASVAREDERRAAMERLKDLTSQIARSRDSLPTEATPEPIERLGVHDQVVTVEVPRYVEALARLADLLSRRRFYALRKSVLDSVAKTRDEAARRALLWAFDSDSLSRFLTRFWADLLTGPIASETPWKCVENVPPFDAIGIGQEIQDGNMTSSVQAEATRFLRKPSTVFLLLDAGQPGSTGNQLERSDIRRSLKGDTGLVVVVQSFKGLEKEIAESFWELMTVIRQAGLRPDAFLANDDEVMLSVLVDRLGMDGEGLRTQADETRWLAQFGLTDPDQRGRFGRVLGEWREMSRRAKERAHG
jgi:hypothetical protein